MIKRRAAFPLTFPLERQVAKLLGAALLSVGLILTGCRANPPQAANTAQSPGSPVSVPGTGPGPAPAPAPASDASAAPAAAMASWPAIVAFGDSLTAGFGADPGHSYPDELQKDLDARGYHYRVVNEGISGNTTKDGVDRLQDVLSLKPALVIVAFGGNDGLRGLPISTTRANLNQIVSTLLDSGAKVVLGGITLPPNYGPDYIRQFDQTYALLSAKYKVPLLPFLLKNVYGVPGSMQEDGIHATDQGNVQVAKNLLPLVVPFLKKPVT